MTTLHLTLKKKWFDKILSGEKKEEYRENKPYWRSRLIANTPGHTTLFKRFNHIIFKNGYGKDAPTMTVECLGIELRKHEHVALDTIALDTGELFVIKLGKVRELR